MSLRTWVKKREHPLARMAYGTAMALRNAQVPVIRPIHLPLYHLRNVVNGFFSKLMSAVWYTPLFQARLVRPAKRLYVFSAVPQVLGTMDIEFGPDCSISGHTTLSGRTAGTVRPLLKVGRNSEIGWQTTIAVGSKVIIGDNVLVAARCFLAGYPGHPQDATARAAHLPDTDDQVGDIVLEDGAWLATDVTVMAGVTIGKGAIVTAGSVVYRDIPAGMIATGNPARAVVPVKPATTV